MSVLSPFLYMGLISENLSLSGNVPVENVTMNGLRADTMK
jgi:hypothetical protein